MNTHAVDAFHKMVRSEAVCRVDVVPARRHEHLELPGDGPAGSDDDDPPDVSGKACAGGAVLAAAVHGVPRDQHRHDTGLAGSGSHADRKAHQVAAPPARTLAKFHAVRCYRGLRPRSSTRWSRRPRAGPRTGCIAALLLEGDSSTQGANAWRWSCLSIQRDSSPAPVAGGARRAGRC